MSVEVRSAAEADKEDRRQKGLIIALFVIGFLGLGYAVYDYMNLVDRATLPQDLTQVDPVIEKWKEAGLVYSFDTSKSTMVVNETEWNGKKKAEKMTLPDSKICYA